MPLSSETPGSEAGALFSTLAPELHLGAHLRAQRYCADGEFAGLIIAHRLRPTPPCTVQLRNGKVLAK